MSKKILKNEYQRLKEYIEYAYKGTLMPIDFSKLVMSKESNLGMITNISTEEITKYLLMMEKIQRKIKEILVKLEELKKITLDKNDNEQNEKACDVIFFPNPNNDLLDD